MAKDLDRRLGMHPDREENGDDGNGVDDGDIDRENFYNFLTFFEIFYHFNIFWEVLTYFGKVNFFYLFQEILLFSFNLYW